MLPAALLHTPSATSTRPAHPEAVAELTLQNQAAQAAFGATPQGQVTLSHDWHPKNDLQRGGGPLLCQGHWAMYNITHTVISFKASSLLGQALHKLTPNAWAGPVP